MKPVTDTQFWMLMALFIVVTVGIALRLFLSDYSLLSKDGHNIALGLNAGYDLTTESFQFCFTVDNKEYRTTMTPKEYEAVFAVSKRAAANPYEPEYTIYHRNANGVAFGNR